MLANILNLIQSYKKVDKVDHEHLRDLEIGCSFDPFHQIFFETDLSPLTVLKYIHEELKVHDIRLGIRWSHVYKDGKVDLSLYEQYLNYCKSKKIKLTLNVGPIKVMRWPEEHIPAEYKSLIKHGDKISLDHPIANVSLRYLEELLKLLEHDYKQVISTLQANNELFNVFGVYGLVITSEFEQEVLRLISKYFPNTSVLINSSGTNDFRKIFKLIDSLSGRFILGVNYYYKTKFQHRVPLLNRLDNLILRKPLSLSPKTVKSVITENGYEIEVSELQGEPWWPNALTPGNSYREFVLTLLRIRYLKPANQTKLLVRYWGIEDLVSKFLFQNDSDDNRRIKDLIIKLAA